jgi:carboxypeptidase Q
MRPLLIALLMSVAGPVVAADDVDRSTLNRIVDEGFNHSELPQTAQYLTDRIGGRMTNSPQMRAAEKWTQDQFRRWNLQNVRTEAFEFGRGWSIEHSEVRMSSPRVLVLRAIPVAWTPPTNGTLSATIVVAPMKRERDFAKWKGQLRGKIVLVDRPTVGSEPADGAPYQRLSDDDLDKLDVYAQPTHSEAAIEKIFKKDKFAALRDAFLASEGALAWIRESVRDGGLLHGDGYSYAVGATPALPGIELAAEDYRKLARLAKAGVTPTLEITSDVRFHDEDHNAYNVFADIRGRDAKAGYVMAGAHLDSWVASDGAQDNGAGTVVIMEAARILAKLGLKPKRTIRFALWAGEEQALLGSLTFIERHLAQRAPITDPEKAKVNPYYTWKTRWPITPLPEGAALSGYFNVDNGSGKVRGIYTEGNLAVVPIFREWLEPFESMGVTKVVAQATDGTDHEFMQAIGVPAFQFIQDPLDYDSRIHHTSIDSYDHLKITDLKQAAVVLASMLWMSAERDQPLPRMPVQRKPAETDPFRYEDDEEE